MDKKINADIKSLKFIFNKNKSYILPVVVILASIMLFFQFVIPQFNELLEARKKALAAAARLETLKANLDVVNNINEQVLDSQLKVLELALPLDKDFIGILNTVYLASQQTGVNLGSFSFKVGDLAQPEIGNNFPVVNLSLPVNSSVAAINNFVETISKTVPLSETSLIKVGNASSTINLSFYYKPVNASNYSQDVRISPISQKGLTLIGQLSQFENVSLSGQ